MGGIISMEIDCLNILNCINLLLNKQSVYKKNNKIGK